MKIIDNLKQKWRTAKMPVTFNEEDIKLLAAMSETYMTLGNMKINGLFLYSYYKPRYESDIDLARHLFEKNGVNVKKYTGRAFYWDEKGTVLRVRFRRTDKGRQKVDFFVRIEDADADLLRPSNGAEEWNKYQQMLEEKRTEFNAR